MFTISDKQSAVINATGNLLVLGGPGSGKTTIALFKANQIINSGILKPEQKILFLSFARATISRVEEHALSILKGCDTSALEITTYHSFFWNLLRSHGYLLIPHRIQLLPPHDASSKLSSFVSKEERETEKTRLFMEEGLLHFDLFAKNCMKLLSGSVALSKIFSNAYPIIILDEFQDTNEDEWATIAYLGKWSTLIALADPEQRIYDFRGADPARIGHFIERFHPQEFNFGIENNRSNGTDIVEFGNDLLTEKNKHKSYKDVQICCYPFSKNKLECLKMKTYIMGRLEQECNNEDWSLAILVPTNRLMMTLSDILGKQNRSMNGGTIPIIHHEVSMDVAGPTIAAILIARLLELSSQGICTISDLVNYLREHILGRRGDRSDKGISQKEQKMVKALLNYVVIGDYSRPMRAKSRQQIIDECGQIVETCNGIQYTGDVVIDWKKVRDVLSTAKTDSLNSVYKDSFYIKLLHKSSLLSNSLALLWRTNRNYAGATEAIKQALTQEHFATSSKTWNGVNVMTIHKAKGKEFDEVIIYDGPFDGQRIVVKNDLDRAKRTLRVAITRAKKRVIIFTPQKNPCPLLY